MASNVHPNAMGCFVGISNYHTREHFARSVYEGITFSHRFHLEKLLSTKKETTKSIRLAGGAARSPVWTQIFADVMNLPVESVIVNETGALGCAILGAVATGRYGSVTEAAKAMCNIKSQVLPRTDKVEIYNKKYGLYKKTIESLDPLWDQIIAYTVNK